MKRILLLLLLCCLSFIGILAQATTLYVAHEPSVIVRDAPNENANTLVELSKGEPVELLKTNLENGYSFIKTEKGESGWVISSYLSEPSQPEKANFLTKWWHKLLEKSPQPNPIVSKKLPSTHNAIIDQQNQKMAAAIESNNAAIEALQRQTQTLTQQVNQLETNGQALAIKLQHANWRWFSYGIILSLCAVLLGILIGSIRLRRRDRWF